MKNKKNISLVGLIMSIILFIIGVGITFAAYTYSRQGTSNSKQIVGDIYMHYTESNALTLSNAIPSSTFDSTKYFEFTVDGKNTNTKYDIIYDVTLNKGDNHQTRTERLNDKFLKFTLMEKKSGESEWTTVVDAKNYSDLSSGIRVWKDTIEKNTMSEVVHTYRLYMWIDNSVVIGNVSEADYDLDTWNDDVYASVKVTVTGDFEDKEIYKAGSEKVLNAALNRANDGSNCLTTVEEDGITYISGTKDCINFNYVWWSGKMWRITAIYPDGAMKMITDNNITSIAFNESGNVTYYDKTNGTKSYMFQWLNEDFLDTLYNNGADVIDTTKYWNATMPVDENIETKPLETEATMISTTTSPVGLLNSYEYYKSYQNTTYGNGYLNIVYYWWLLNPYNASYVWDVFLGSGNSFSPTGANGSRPSIYLKSGVTLIGKGTKQEPYRLSEDFSDASNNDLLYTRHSGEYVKLSNNGTEQLFRIVEVVDNKTKIVAMDYADNKATRQFATSSSDTLWGSGTTTGTDTWYTYLNGTYYPGLVSTYGELFDSATYYLGTSGNNYKLSVCANTTSGNTKVCDKTSQVGTFNIGLLRYGEMFATQQGSGYSSSIDMWLINRYSASYVWYFGSIGNSYIYDPTYTYGSRPSIHLKSTVKILSGTGTELDPYVVGL